VSWGFVGVSGARIGLSLATCENGPEADEAAKSVTVAPLSGLPF
jgi:hypothetical protein